MMLTWVRNRLALSEKGARDFLKGVWATTLLDIALMLPAVAGRSAVPQHVYHHLR